MNKIKRLKKWKFKEKKIPIVVYWFLLLAILTFSLGAYSNFIAISTNGGRMPIIADYKYSTDKYFTVQNLSEVKNIYLADIYPIKGRYWSIGDFFLILSIFFFVFSFIFEIYNNILNAIIKRKWSMKQ